MRGIVGRLRGGIREVHPLARVPDERRSIQAEICEAQGIPGCIAPALNRQLAPVVAVLVSLSPVGSEGKRADSQAGHVADSAGYRAHHQRCNRKPRGYGSRIIAEPAESGEAEAGEAASSHPIRGFGVQVPGGAPGSHPPDLLRPAGVAVPGGEPRTRSGCLFSFSRTGSCFT